MPLMPNLVERMLFLQFNQGPGPLLDLVSAVGFRAVVAAVRLGYFDALDGGPLRPAEAASRTGTDLRGAEALLDLLAGLGYVRREGDRYANTPMAAHWLAGSSPASIAPGIRYWGTILSRLWGSLEESVRAGAPATNLYDWIEHEPEVSQDFQDWMVALARLAGGEIVDKLGRFMPPAARRILDVGGGHGTYSISLCRRFPALTATVFDSPQALQSARQNIAQAGLADRVRVLEGDMLKDDLGGDYDVALLFNIIHGFVPEEIVAVCRRVAAALKPGGLIAIAEQLAGDAPGPASRAANAMFRLSYFHLLGGGIYSFEDIARWLSEAGFGSVRRLNLLKVPGSGLVLGTKAAWARSASTLRE